MAKKNGKNKPKAKQVVEDKEMPSIFRIGSSNSLFKEDMERLKKAIKKRD